MLTSSSNPDRVVSIKCDPILSEIILAVVKAKLEDIPDYLRNAAWLCENVPIDILKGEIENGRTAKKNEAAPRNQE